MSALPLDFEPGTQWSYSNSGYMLAGILISKVAGKHWSEFLDERLFDKIGMTTTRVITEEAVVKHRAAGYSLNAEGETVNQEWVAPSLNRVGDGALYFSTEDLAAWDRALREKSFLEPSGFEEMFRPVSLANGTTYPYGFGWDITDQRGHTLMEHGGSWQGFKAAISRYVDQGLTVAVLANSSQTNPMVIAHEVAGLLEPELRRPDPGLETSDPDPERTQTLLRVLEAYGRYQGTDEMAKGLRETGAGSGREAYVRNAMARALEGRTGFRYLGEDDLSGRQVICRGERVDRLLTTRLTGRGPMKNRYGARWSSG